MGIDEAGYQRLAGGVDRLQVGIGALDLGARTER
jgi:hypothetical protein